MSNEDVLNTIGATPSRKVLYLDESGINPDLPFTVVSGFLVDRRDEAKIIAANEVIRRNIPEQYRGFECHARTLFTHELWPGWAFAGRKRFLLDLMSIPKVFGLPVITAYVRRESQLAGVGNLSAENIRHLWAFAVCVSTADYVIRTRGFDDDVGFVIAEDNEEMRDTLRNTIESLMRRDPWWLVGDQPGARIFGTGPPIDFQVSRMHAEPAFLQKGRLELQIADACAWGIRRAIERPDEHEYYQAIFDVAYREIEPAASFGRACREPPRFRVRQTGTYRIIDPTGELTRRLGIPNEGGTAPRYEVDPDNPYRWSADPDLKVIEPGQPKSSDQPQGPSEPTR